MSILYCPHCGFNIVHTKQHIDIYPSCGELIEGERKMNQQTHIHVHVGRGPFNKWIALLLLIFLGVFGAHKFYEGKILMGVLYLFTAGFLGIGIVFDFFGLLFKPTEYYL
jgi:hypothetical protein